MQGRSFWDFVVDTVPRQDLTAALERFPALARLQHTARPSSVRSRLRCLLDTETTSLLRELCAADERWQSRAAAFATSVHNAAVSLVLTGSDGSTTTRRTVGTAARAALVSAGLLPPQAEGFTPTAAGIAFAMQSPAAQHTVLLQAAAAHVSRTAPSALHVLTSVAAMACANTAVAYAFPRKEDLPCGAALLRVLSELGLVFLFVHPATNAKLFLLPPPFAAAVRSPKAAGKRPREETTGDEAEVHVAAAATGCELLSLLAAPNAAMDSGLATDWATPPTEDCLVTETNFRIYAYLHGREPTGAMSHGSRVVIHLLDCFAERETLVAGFAVYRLTRDAFLAASAHGIRKAQVLQFLTARAHPAIRCGTGQAIPPSVMDQLTMWEREARLLVATPDQVLLTCPSPQVCDRIIQMLARHEASVATQFTGERAVEGVLPTNAEDQALPASVVFRSAMHLVLSRQAFDAHVAGKIR